MLGRGLPARRYPPAATYPEPVEHCEVCRWAEACVQRRREDDHLSLVAGSRRASARPCARARSTRSCALASAPLPFDPAARRDSAASARARPRAGPDPGRGPRTGPGRSTSCSSRRQANRSSPSAASRRCPSRAPGDLFLDLEGDPYALDDGVDYLFGVLDRRASDVHADLVASTRTARRGHARRREGGVRAAHRPPHRRGSTSTRRCTSTTTRRYEPTALKRLMGRHATREDEVDRLLRGGVLVDLYARRAPGPPRVGRELLDQAARAAVRLQRASRSCGTPARASWRSRSGSSSARATGRRPTSSTRSPRYNRDDVGRAPLACATGSRSCATSSRARTGLEVPRPPPARARRRTTSPRPLARVAEVADRADRRRARRTRPSAAPSSTARWLLAQLLSWHRREEKATYWEFFHRAELDGRPS